MAYIGNSAANQTFTPIIDTFNGNGSTTAFTLTYPVASVAQVEAYISNVPQQPGVAYTVLGNTITFTSAPPSGTANIYVRYTSPITQIMQPGQGTVGTTQMMDAAVTAAKIASGQVLPAAGISFPATQSASSDPNTLDDYEEGTFTPSLSDGTNSVSLGTAYYTKIGRLINVAVQGYNKNFSALTKTASLRVSGFPFASNSSAILEVPISTNNTNTTAGYGTVCMEIGTGSTTFYMYFPNGAIDFTNCTVNNLVGGANTFSCRFSFTYISD